MEESGTLTLRDQHVTICRKLQEHLLVKGLELTKYLIRRNFPASIEVLRSFVKKYHGSPRVTHDILARVREISALLPKDLSDVECLGINNTRKKLIRRKEPDVNNLIRRKKAKKGFQTENDNNFTNRAPPTRDFVFLKKYVPYHSCFSDVLIVCLSKNSTFVSSVNKLKQVKPLAGYLHLITNAEEILNLDANYEASSIVHKIHYEREESFTNSHGVLIQYHEIPRKPPWFVAMCLMCGSLERRTIKRDATAKSTPCSAIAITTKELSEGFQMMLAAGAHLRNKNVGSQLGTCSVVVIISVGNQQQVVVHSTRPYSTIRVSTQPKSTEITNGIYEIPRKTPCL
ncbi:hypothetical protein MKX03_012041, partial [Papaver bracteatum]